RDPDLVPLSPTYGMLQVYKNTNAPLEKKPDSSSQISATLDLKDSKFFSKSCGAGCRSGRIRWFVTYMMGPCRRDGGRWSPGKRRAGGVVGPSGRRAVLGSGHFRGWGG